MMGSASAWTVATKSRATDVGIPATLQNSGTPSTTVKTTTRRKFNSAIIAGIAGCSLFSGVPSPAYASTTAASSGFRRIPTQFIAALGDPKSNVGEIGSARDWGLWVVDPGPRGVYLNDAKKLEQRGVGPYGWSYNPDSWWLEEHGLIMESPDFPVPPGRYLVTGGRETTAVLTIVEDGSWSLDQGTLFDVTHLPCRSARYTPKNEVSRGNSQCSPVRANPSNFPVRPGAAMPAVGGCNKQDYAVLFVIGVEDSEPQRKLEYAWTR